MRAAFLHFMLFSHSRNIVYVEVLMLLVFSVWSVIWASRPVASPTSCHTYCHRRQRSKVFGLGV
ncbi:hypothetical protein CISIN_1g037107mg [Citrus sinensis]|uniref:Uncharacterized protein n=1 Tax=Citrus sinensis TaxID=2711 RepID=A0A067E1G8_CITSI|nr:hypothetical protein CISIN_1g037107mg [Citrus sinensis]